MCVEQESSLVVGSSYLVSDEPQSCVFDFEAFTQLGLATRHQSGVYTDRPNLDKTNSQNQRDKVCNGDGYIDCQRYHQRSMSVDGLKAVDQHNIFGIVELCRWVVALTLRRRP